jgi:hypothetical protein
VTPGSTFDWPTRRVGAYHRPRRDRLGARIAVVSGTALMVITGLVLVALGVVTR